MKKILLIEDDQSRIEWLKEFVGDIAEITWHTNVKSFVTNYTFGVWDLVIFDFDLTPDFATPIFNKESGLWFVPTQDIIPTARFDFDGDDLNGLDAAKLIPKATKQTHNQPFLIWSANDTGRPMIAKSLVDSGYLNVTIQPYDFYHLDKLKSKIEFLLRE